MHRRLIVACSVLSACSSALGSSPEELGKIRWGRSLDAAKDRARASSKPVLLLFDEVPGCETVRGFGKRVLSDPDIVEIVESHFVPVVIFNNVRGKDREVLEAFGEPSWNNPVVRILTAEGKEIAPRFAGPYTTKKLAAAMLAALKATERPIPPRLIELASGHQNAASTVVLGMYCFWEGEAQLGDLEGVTETSVGFVGGHEAVRVTFDPTKTTAKAILKEAHRRGVADIVFVHSKQEEAIARSAGSSKVVRTDREISRSAKDEKYYLKRSPLKDLTLTETQASRVNAALRKGQDVRRYLTDRQIAELRQ